MISTVVLLGAAGWMWWAECRCGRLEMTPTPASDFARHVRLAHTKAPSGAGEDIL